MPTMTRDELICLVTGQAGVEIISLTWEARGDKKENRCPYCNDTLCRKAQQWVCNEHGVVNAVRQTIRRKGDLITRTVIPTINREKLTKNWEGVTKENSGKDGQWGDMPTKAAADAKKREHGLVGVTKMSGEGDGKKGVPITVPVYDIQSVVWKGDRYDITD